MRIVQFEDETYNEFKSKFDELKSKNMKSLIIDVRENGGGNLAIASDIIDELIPEGIIVYTKDKNGKKEYLYSKPNEIKVPLAVLVNENTASASEILTAAIQDSKKGTIIGTKTFGKGVVQIVEELSDGSGIKLTISEYFSPKGRKINKKGIEPDIKVELNEDIEGIGPEYINEDNQLQKAIEIVKSKEK
ncbi:MAG: S41 family peptidase [Andreesenia angusta]|nr:S41 family peptidase [Andreesenia angusta]